MEVIYDRLSIQEVVVEVAFSEQMLEASKGQDLRVTEDSAQILVGKKTVLQDRQSIKFLECTGNNFLFRRWKKLQ